MKSSSLSSSSDKPDPNKNPNLVVYGPSHIYASSKAKVSIASVKATYLEVNNSGGTVTPEMKAILQSSLSQASSMSIVAHGPQNITAEGGAELTIGDTDTTAIRYNNEHNSSSTALINKGLQLASVARTSISNKDTGYIHRTSDQENIINKAIRLIEQIYPEADEDDADIKKFRREQLALLRSFSIKEPDELEISHILELITGLAASLPSHERKYPYHSIRTINQENHHRELKSLPKISKETLATSVSSLTHTSQTLYHLAPLKPTDRELIKKARDILDREYPETDANQDESIRAYRESILRCLGSFENKLTEADKNKINDLIKGLSGEEPSCGSKLEYRESYPGAR